MTMRTPAPPSEPSEKTQIRSTRLLVLLVALNSALLVASNAGAAKIITVYGSLSASAAVVTYILAVAIIDLVNETFGPRLARMVANIGFVSLITSVALFQLFIRLPSAGNWSGQAGYAETLGPGLRVLLGGWLAYAVSQPLNVRIFTLIRTWTSGRWFLVRKLGSTLVSQLVDTVIFITIAFGGVYELIPIYVGQYAVKIVLVSLEAPLAVLCRAAIQRYLGAAHAPSLAISSMVAAVGTNRDSGEAESEAPLHD